MFTGVGFPAQAGGDPPTAGGKPDSSETTPDTSSDAVRPRRSVPAFAPFVLPAPPALSVVAPKPLDTGVNWVGLSQASFRFLVAEHGFRLVTEPGTRSGLNGPYLRNYGRAMGNLHGWADGDEFYVNYVGHPMEGSVAGFLFVQNDRTYRRAEFGASPAYWKSRLRAAGFAWAFSTQFEIGPLSEASIGAIQTSFPQQGFADHVITPAVGMAWMIGEDAVDRYLIKRIEAATANPYVRFLVRSGLNPTRSFANVLQGRVPWNRETRAGVKSYIPADERLYASSPERATPREASAGDFAPAAPFEFAITFQPQRFLDSKTPACLGGGATVGFRLTPSWQLIADVGGCKMVGLEKDVSGDSLTYMVGPRWISRIHGPWSAYLQFLAGGNKITEERMYPELKQLLERTAAAENKLPPSHEDYTDATESNGFAVSTGGGLNYNLHPALTLRVADLSYRRAWTAPLWGREYSGGLQWSSGLVLRMGTW
jgi:hypothetical protein